MFEVLVYLYENYWRPDACPDHQQLSRKLSAVGFESDEIQDALRWLDGLAHSAEACTGTPVPGSMRIYTEAEQRDAGRGVDRLHRLPRIGRRAAGADARDGDRPRHAPWAAARWTWTT